MSKKLSFALGIHNHQPLGNFPHVFRQAAEKAYRPFLEVLWEYPEIPVTLHYTGVVLEWIQTNDPSMIELIKRMVQRGQIELLTGGYYEPILPMIADRDKIGQIRKLTLTLQQLFGYDPSGMWLAERIWEPQLTKPIAEAGVKYIIVDDSHFKLAGVPQNQLYGYYTIGEQGLSLAVFPISEKLRYDIPFKPAEEVVDYLLSVASSGEERLLVMADDGEKFGVWPETYQWVYEKRWLRRFFDELKNHRETIECVKLSDYLSNHVPLGPVYLPTAANPEMMKWALSATQRNDLTNLMNQDETGEYRPYLQGGFWRQFLSKYRESDNMTKKMLYVGSRIEQLPKSHRQEPLEILWGGQCNCGYWHGVFGGLYLNHLRTAVYRSFLEAEKEVDRLQHPQPGWIEIEGADFYRDGTNCVLASTARANLYFDLSHGGALFELDDKRKLFNLLNTMSRYEESCHEEIHQQQDEKMGNSSPAEVVYDWYRRSALIDHFLAPEVSLDEFSKANYEESGDFVNEPYKASWKVSGQKGEINLWRDGHLKHRGQRMPLRVDKTIHIDADSCEFSIDYRLTNRSPIPLPVRFGIEFGFALQAGDTPNRYYLIPGRDDHPPLGTSEEHDNLNEISLVEEWLGLRVDLQFDRPLSLWRFPVETVSSNQNHFSKNYQSSVVMPWTEQLLEPETPFTLGLVLNIKIAAGSGKPQ